MVILLSSAKGLQFSVIAPILICANLPVIYDADTGEGVWLGYMAALSQIFALSL